MLLSSNSLITPRGWNKPAGGLIWTGGKKNPKHWFWERNYSLKTSQTDPVSWIHLNLCVYLNVSSEDLTCRGFQDLTQEKLLRDHQSSGLLLRNLSPLNSRSRAWARGQWHPIAPHPQAPKHIQPPEQLTLTLNHILLLTEEGEY